MKINFYILNQHKAQDHLGFVCQLVKTVRQKSPQPILILADNDTLQTLDERLWSFEATSFIPHQIYQPTEHKTTNTPPYLSPQVILSENLIPNFYGIIINLTDHLIDQWITNLSQHSECVLEISTDNPQDLSHSRQKYRHYQQQGFTLAHFKI